MPFNIFFLQLGCSVVILNFWAIRVRFCEDPCKELHNSFILSKRLKPNPSPSSSCSWSGQGVLTKREGSLHMTSFNKIIFIIYFFLPKIAWLDSSTFVYWGECASNVLEQVAFAYLILCKTGYFKVEVSRTWRFLWTCVLYGQYNRTFSPDKHAS